MKRAIPLIVPGILALGVAGAAVPSFAENIASCRDEISNAGGENSEHLSFIDQDSAAIAAGLKDKGINATDISDWGGCVKADVVQKNGSTAQEFFDPSTLQRVHVNGG